jgi:hypothetical protein
MAHRRENRRRSSRLSLRVPVRIYGRTAENQPFRELTDTLAVNAHGARVELSVPVTQGQTLLLVHGITEEEKECRVVDVQAMRRAKWKLGLEFVRAEGNFWQLFQPLRTASAERKHHVE